MEKKIKLIAGIIVAIIVIGGISYILYTRDDEKSKETDFSKIKSKINSVLTGGWEIIDSETNTVPHGYEGSSVCFYIKIQDSDTIEDKTSDKPIDVSNNHPFYYLWFTPLDWDGTITDTFGSDWIPSSTTTKEYKIFSATDGDSSDTLDQIIEKFNE